MDLFERLKRTFTRNKRHTGMPQRPFPLISTKARSAVAIGPKKSTLKHSRSFPQTNSEVSIELKFEPTWDDVLHSGSTQLFLQFREFVYQRLAAENLSFIVAAERYSKLEDLEERVKFARSMYDMYVNPEADNPINITGRDLNVRNQTGIYLNVTHVI